MPVFVRPNSADTELMEEWSPSARAASAASRSRRGQGYLRRKDALHDAYRSAGGPIRLKMGRRGDRYRAAYGAKVWKAYLNNTLTKRS